MKIHARDIVVLVFLVFVAVFTYRYFVSGDCYGYDEADYMYAASKGLWGNYIDAGVIPIATFIEMGRRYGMEKQKRTTLAEFIRSSDDVSFYRHYHGPLYHYGLIVSRVLFADREWFVRWYSLAILLVSVVVMFLLLRFLLGENDALAAFLPAVLMLFSRNNIIASAHITPHGLYVLLVVVTLAFTAKYLATRDTRYWYVTIVAAALAFITIEFALLLVASLLVCLFVARKDLFPGWTLRRYSRFILKSGLLFIATVVVFWPGSILKLTIFKNYLFFTYYALVRGSEYGDQTFFEAWRDRIASAPVEYSVIIIALLMALKLVSRNRKLLPFLVYPGFIFLTTIRNTSQSPMYISSFLPPLFILGGIVFAAYTRRLKFVIKAVPVLVVAGALATFTFLKTVPDYSEIAGSSALRSVVTFVREFTGEKNSILIDRDLLPTLHYYFPGEKFKSFSEESGDNKQVDELLSRYRMKGVLIATTDQGVQDLEQQLDKKYFFTGHFISYMEEAEQTVLYYEIETKP